MIYFDVYIIYATEIYSNQTTKGRQGGQKAPGSHDKLRVNIAILAASAKRAKRGSKKPTVGETGGNTKKYLAEAKKTGKKEQGNKDQEGNVVPRSIRTCSYIKYKWLPCSVTKTGLSD